MSLKLMEQFFVKNLGFKSLTPDYQLKNLEEYLYLVKQGKISISVEKFQGNDDYKTNISADPSEISKYNKYISYFLDKNSLVNNGYNDFIKEMDKKINEYRRKK